MHERCANLPQFLALEYVKIMGWDSGFSLLGCEYGFQCCCGPLSASQPANSRLLSTLSHQSLLVYSEGDDPGTKTQVEEAH